jgi:anti-sigma factor RsiW
MNCRDAEHVMQQALDVPLTSQARARLDLHLDGCPACRQAWEDYRRLSREASAWAARPASGETPPAEFTAQVLARLKTRPRPALPWPRLLSAAAAVLLLAALSPLAAPWLPPVPRLGAAWAMPALWTETAALGALTARWAMLLLLPSLVVNALFVLRARRAA